VTTSDVLLLPERNAWSLELTAAREKTLRRLAKAIKKDEPALAVLSPYVLGMHAEILDAPSLVIEDHGGIRLFEKSGDKAYSYRALLLADDDDLVAIGVPRNDGFEAYCRDWLGLGAPRLLTPKISGPDDSLATRCRLDANFIDSVTAHAEYHNGLNVLPYMGSWPIWELAGEIARNSRAPVRVIAPPPQLSLRVNDKIWFTELAQKICGQDATPPARPAHNFTNLCQITMDLGREYPSIAIKLPDSASSAGNLVLNSGEIRKSSIQQLYQQLNSRLLTLGWNGKFPLLVNAWENPIIASPSVHLWIPAIEVGLPLVEAIYDQHTSGLEREFDGATPCRLGQDWQFRLARQAFQLGRVLQHLGYFGRCSLDAIIIGADLERAQLHWVECNGRWSGVSIPLSLNRRLDRVHAMPFVILEEAHQQLAARELGQVLQSLESLLYQSGKRESGAILLSPGRLLDGTGFELMVRDASLDSAIDKGRKFVHQLGEIQF